MAGQVLFATHWALVCSHPSAVCVRASVPVIPWETSRIAEKTRAALPDHWSPASITRVAPDRRQQLGAATSRRRNCRLRPPFKGVMRWRMKDPPNLAMRWRIAGGYDALTHTQRCALVTTSTSWDQMVATISWPRNPLKQRTCCKVQPNLVEICAAPTAWTSLQGSTEPCRRLRISAKGCTPAAQKPESRRLSRFKAEWVAPRGSRCRRWAMARDRRIFLLDVRDRGAQL